MKKGIKRILSLMLVSAMTLTLLTGCGGGNKEKDAGDAAEPTPVENETEEPAETATEGAKEKKVAYITMQSLSAPFMTLCHQSVEKLEEEGWTNTDYELSEASEIGDAIRSAAADGCSSIFVMLDDIAPMAIELSDELAENYPDLTVFCADAYTAQDTPNVVNIICDSWESSFMAGYVAAITTEKDQIGFIGCVDATVIHRFLYGFECGVKYAGLGQEVVVSYIGTAEDSLKGQEVAKAMITNNDIDTIFQAASLSGTGVIAECKEQGVKCIGCDSWQGGEFGQDTVYWSALKSIQEAMYNCAVAAQNGTLEDLVGTGTGRYYYYDAAAGASLYAQEDLELLDAETQAKIKEVLAGVQDGSIDVYEGYDEYRFSGLE